MIRPYRWRRWAGFLCASIFGLCRGAHPKRSNLYKLIEFWDLRGFRLQDQQPLVRQWSRTPPQLAVDRQIENRQALEVASQFEPGTNSPALLCN